MTGNRWVGWTVWVAILAPIPYGLSRVLWAAGVPVGITDEFLRELGSPGWGSLGLVFLAVLSEGTGAFTHVFIHRRPQRVPSWVPLLNGRPVRPAIVVGLAALPIFVLAAVNAGTVREIIVHGDLLRPTGFPDEPAWSLWTHQLIFLAWGTALAVATFGYWRATGTTAPDAAFRE